MNRWWGFFNDGCETAQVLKKSSRNFQWSVSPGASGLYQDNIMRAKMTGHNCSAWPLTKQCPWAYTRGYEFAILHEFKMFVKCYGILLLSVFFLFVRCQGVFQHYLPNCEDQLKMTVCYYFVIYSSDSLSLSVL